MKYAKLIMVSEENNNRFVEMKQINNDSFQVFTGRVDLTRISQGIKPLSTWDKYYKSKTRKSKKPFPYIDITANSSTILEKAKFEKSHPFLEKLYNFYSYKLDSTYVSSVSVTPFQIEQLGRLLDKLANCETVENANQILISVFTHAPRKMQNVGSNLLTNISQLSDKLSSERDNLETLKSGQLLTNNDKLVTLEDKLKLKITDCTNEEVDKIKSMGANVKNAYSILSETTNNNFLKNRDSKLLWHNTSSSNWINILRTGLKIFPNATNGRKYGNGIYFANNIQKSLGYGGNIIGLFEVATGIRKVVSSRDVAWRNISISSEYDSLHVKDCYDEIIVYDESQVDIRYIIELGD